MEDANITDRFCDISLSGDVHTYYDGGGGKHASFSLDKSSIVVKFDEVEDEYSGA